MSTAASFPLPPESAPQPATSVSVAPEHLAYMRQALEAAEAATRRGEVPVGAVVVAGGTVLSLAHNERETGNDPTAHAEVLALRRAAATLGSWRLTEADLYVTMEPCPMCAGAIVNARVRRVYYGCDDPKAGAVRTLARLALFPFTLLYLLCYAALAHLTRKRMEI